MLFVGNIVFVSACGICFLPKRCDTVDAQNSIRPTWLGVVNHPIKGDEEEISVGNLRASWAGDCITNWMIWPRKRKKHHLPLHHHWGHEMMGSNVLSIGASVTGIMPAITVRKLVTEASPRKGMVAAPGAGSWKSGGPTPSTLEVWYPNYCDFWENILATQSAGETCMSFLGGLRCMVRKFPSTPKLSEQFE